MGKSSKTYNRPESKKYPKKDCTLGDPSFEIDKESIEAYKKKAGYPKNFIGCIEPSLTFKYLKDETEINND